MLTTINTDTKQEKSLTVFGAFKTLANSTFNPKLVLGAINTSQDRTLVQRDVYRASQAAGAGSTENPQARSLRASMNHYAREARFATSLATDPATVGALYVSNLPTAIAHFGLMSVVGLVGGLLGATVGACKGVFDGSVSRSCRKGASIGFGIGAGTTFVLSGFVILPLDLLRLGAALLIMGATQTLATVVGAAVGTGAHAFGTKPNTEQLCAV